MCVEDRKAMRADQERRAEIIKVLKIRQHFNDFYMRIVDNVAFFLTQIKSSETIVIFKSKGGTILQSINCNLKNLCYVCQWEIPKHLAFPGK